MKDTLLFTLITRFDRLETDESLHFVTVHDHSKEQPYAKLYRFLINAAADSVPTHEQAWQYLYGQAPYRQLRFNNIISQTLALVYAYLGRVRASRETNLINQLQLTEQLHGLDLPKQAGRQQAKLTKQLDEAEQRSHHHAWLRHRAEELSDRMLLRRQRNYSPHLQRSADELDRYYLTNKLRIACDMLARGKVVKSEGYQFRMVDQLIAEFTTELDSPENEDFIAAYLYRAMYNFLRLPTAGEPEYKLIYQALRKHGDYLELGERKNLYDYLLNHLIGRINRGETAAYTLILDLYQYLLETELLLVNGRHLSQFTYSNICTTGLRLKAFTWTENFLHQYRSQLFPEQRENAFTYNLASLHFAKEELDETLFILAGLEFTDAFYFVSAKLLQAKIYYITANLRSYLSTLESARLYLIRNHQLADYQRRSIRNFIKIATKMGQLRKRSEQYRQLTVTDLDKLKKHINDTRELAQRDWLLTSVDALREVVQ